MGKIKKKGQAGAATNYITRSQAIKKLQVSLQDFRRLCILKGIYPREPRNKKKANKGSTAPTTFYYTKDIQYLLHEPLLAKFREFKTFAKKLAKVMGKGQWSTAKSLEENRPVYTLDHIIRERYPSFTDALRDLDDALSMVFLFATMPATDRISSMVVSKCQRLAAEFQHYVIYTRCMRKTFLSIKGIYYQAEIKGQAVTWITPYQFSQHVPTDVDLKVMSTFLELYETLMGFVLFKLYSDANLKYPPRLDIEKDSQAAGLNALILELNSATPVVDTDERVSGDDTIHNTSRTESQERLKSLSEKIKEIVKEDKSQPEDVDDEFVKDDSETLDEFPRIQQTSEDISILPSYKSLATSLTTFQSLFSNLKFYLSREVPRHSLEFLIKSFGGQVGWDAVLGAGSAFDESDPSITHHIIDRPILPNQISGRVYIQPQWIYDCVNAGKLLKTEGNRPDEGYCLGQTLPPHLSPFVESREGEYVPQMDIEDTDLESEAESEVEADKEVEGANEADSEETVDMRDQMELEAESAGVNFSEFQQRFKPVGNENKKSKKAGSTKGGKVMTREEKEAIEKKELAKVMMSKKERHLYDRMQYGIKKKQDEVQNLKRKRTAIEKEKVKKVKSNK